MKKICLLLIASFYLYNCFSQETIEKRNRLSDSVLERFFVYKDNKDVKQGPYKAFFKRRTVVASGYYTNNRKTGIWNFYKPNGLLVQTCDYDKNLITYESLTDTLADVHYLVDKKLTPTDSLTRPVKIGGVYYGLIPYLNLFQLPFDTMGVNTDNFDAYIELLISPLGRLADYKVHLISKAYDYNHTYSLDVNLFSEADKSFIPVTLNKEPVVSRIIIKCFVAANGTLDFD